MRLKMSDIERLSERLVHKLQQEKRFVAKCDVNKLQERVVDIIQKNFEEEDAIDREAKKMLDQFDEQIRRGEVNAHRMLQMIKAKLAKERNFIL